MKVNANFTQPVEVNPKEVIQSLIEEEIGFQNWIFERNGKYYKGFEISAGCHSKDGEEEITQGFYEYIRALQIALKWLS